MIYIATDHAGWKTKEAIKDWLVKKGLPFADKSEKFFDAKDDYPGFANLVAKAVKKDVNAIGVLICDTGVGMAIAANRVKGIRAALVFNNWMARRAREHNHANIIVFGDELQKIPQVITMLQTFLKTKFSSASRHRRRVRQLG
jgi:ribose 5-phosphate isomerase B